MGSLSTLSLQFNRVHLDSTRAQLAARSGLATFLARVYAHDANATLNPLDPEVETLGAVFPDGLEVRQGHYTVRAHFDPEREFFSTDNLAGDAPRTGSPDTDDVPRVPPFALDLVLSVEGPGTTHRYRAVLQRVWPYAVYTTRGPIVLMGQPEYQNPGWAFEMPTLVEGDMFTSWQGFAAAGGTAVTGYGLGLLSDPSDLLANVEARAGIHPQQRPMHPIIIGLPIGTNPTPVPTRYSGLGGSDEVFYRYSASQMARTLGESENQPHFQPGAPYTNDINNVLDGDFYYDHDLDAAIELANTGDQSRNIITGEIRPRRSLNLDPLEMLQGETYAGAPIPSGDYLPLTLPAAPSDTVSLLGLASPTLEFDDDDGSEPFFLSETLVLTEDENSTGGTVTTHYVIEGSVSNRQVLYDSGELYVREKAAGLRMQGTVLHVKGDLDLGATQLDIPIPISGTGATLVVDGKLVLGNAHVDAGDQGFVIYAKDIVLKGGGTFYGLMVAENSITILSQNEEPLTIEGAMLCAGTGGVTLRGAEIKHEPRYLKSISAGGNFQLSSWRKL